MNKFLGGVCALSLTLATGNVVAEESGFKGGFGFLLSNTSSSKVTLDKTMLLGMSGMLGYDVNKYFAIEGRLAAASGAKTNTGLDAGSSYLSLEGVGFYPVNDGLAAYGKLGSASITDSTGTTSAGNKKSNGVVWGAGVELGHGQSASARFGFEHWSGELFNNNAVVLDMVFKF